MKTLTRFGVSIETDLLERFDKFIESTAYVNRSEAFRDLIRGRLVDEELHNENSEVFGILSLVYDHHQRDLEKKLTSIQHDSHANIITTTHVHIDHDNCLEVILLKGKVKPLQQIGSSLAGLKGVTHSRLVFTTTSHANAPTHSKKGNKHHVHDH